MFSNQVGGWSMVGLTLVEDRSNTTSVTCNTTHLTSFAVLVSIQDERPVRFIADSCVIILHDATHFSHLNLIKHYQ